MNFLKVGEKLLQRTSQANVVGRTSDSDGSNHARASTLATQYDFYLSKAIRSDDNMMNLITTLREAGPKDKIVIHINSPGGNLSTTAQLITAMRDCAGHVQTSAEGEVYSAASAIFFAGHSFSISEFADFMLHPCTSGAAGEVDKALKTLENTHRWVTRIYKGVYIPFFTEAEIDEVLAGKEVWLDAEQVSGRIDRVQKDMHDSRSRN